MMNKNYKSRDKNRTSYLALMIIVLVGTISAQPEFSTKIIDTMQISCFDDNEETSCPELNEVFFGQDAQYSGIQFSYIDNGDGTVTDTNTGLMWQQDHGAKMAYDDAVVFLESFELADYDDWRLPTIKELYSLITFNGVDPSGYELDDTSFLTPFIDTLYFPFEYGDTDNDERVIDAQYWSGTEYVSETMNGDDTVFGVNFADGRIKGYPAEPIGPPGMEFSMTSFVKFVRGTTDYNTNEFIDNDDDTITDQSTELMWMAGDSGHLNAGADENGELNWEQALQWAENLEHAGYNDWRLPNAKELQSIVDYTRSPATSGSAAINPVFEVSEITDEGGDTNYPFYWTSTTHRSWNSEHEGASAVYVAFGDALGFMEMQPFSGNYQLLDVHGAGSQRSDPKSGNPDDYPYGHGPQGDVIRIYNYVRCVRDITESQIDGDVNGDNFLDVLDLVQVIGFILGEIDFTLNQQNIADANNDTVVDVLDIVIFVNLILGY